MSGFTLRWRRPPPLLLLQWRGLDDVTMAAQQMEGARPLAAIVGPRGPAGSDPTTDLLALYILAKS